MRPYWQPTPCSATAARRPRILAVDNEKAFLCILRSGLPKGWDLWTTTDAALGLNWFEFGPFDLVIVDLALRPTGGLCFLDEIRQINPNIKAIITSVSPASEGSLKSMNRRRYSFLVKPIDPDAARRTILQSLFV